MLSLTAQAKIPVSKHHISRLEASLFPTLISFCKSNKLDEKRRNALFLGFGFTEEGRALKLGRNLDNSWCCGAKKREADVDLEAEILDFMAKSEKPTMFPTREELVRAGRLDLVLAIKKKGGWLSLGWGAGNVRDDVEESMDSDIAEFQRRIKSCKLSGSSRFSDDVVSSGSRNLDSLQLAGSHSSDSSQQLDGPDNQLPTQPADDEVSGIDGILGRLEKQRYSDFLAIKSAKKGYESQSKSEDVADETHSDTSLDFGGTDLEENTTPAYLEAYHTSDPSDGNIRHYTEQAYHMSDPSDGNIGHYNEQESWRDWIYRRSNIAEFEAGEISWKKDPVDTNKESYHDGRSVTTKEYAEDLDRQIEMNYSEIRTRLRGLEFELKKILQSVRSKQGNNISKEVTGSSSELQNLSDELEFQENEVMSAKQRLRSLRAKLAIAEGKMTLAMINRRKVEEVKQKKLKSARKSLQLLRTTCIMWITSGTEVLLAGSFDGWTTKRRMHRSSRTGIFSITLRLYPGRYEIKFIVDGKWRVDPLRPTVNNNGHENNIYIVT